MQQVQQYKQLVMKKIFYFMMLCLTIVGIIGGIGYTVYDHAYVVSVGLAVAGYMTWPQVRNYYKKLME